MSDLLKSVDIRTRLGWMMGGLAVVAALGAVGVGLNGYLNDPRTTAANRPAALVVNGADDPLAPKVFDKTAQVRVHVAGAVRKPGVYALPDWARVEDAIKKARGPLPTADLDAINLADRIRDGEQIRVPYQGRAAISTTHPPTPDPPSIPPTVGGRGVGRYPFAGTPTQGAPPGGGGGEVDLNTATLEQLESLPGIGGSLAAAIIEYRTQHGRFLQPEDLLNVRGIGQRKFEQIRPRVVVR